MVIKITQHESKFNNMVFEYASRIKDWLKTHSCLPKVINHFISTDKEPHHITLIDFVRNKLEIKETNIVEEERTIVEHRKKLKKQPEIIKPSVELKNFYDVLNDGEIILPKITTEKQSTCTYKTVIGEWQEKGSKSFCDFDDYYADITYIEDKPISRVISLKDCVNHFTMTSRIKIFLQSFGDNEIIVNDLRTFNLIKKDLAMMIENDSLLDLVKSGSIRFSKEATDEIIIDYESRLNKLQGLIEIESNLIKTLSKQIEQVSILKAKLMRNTEDYVKVIMDEKEDNIPIVDKQVFLGCMVLAAKEKALNTMSLNDQISSCVKYYNTLVNVGGHRLTALNHLAEFCDDLEMQDIRLNPLTSVFREKEYDDGYLDDSRENSDYEVLSDYD